MRFVNLAKRLLSLFSNHEFTTNHTSNMPEPIQIHCFSRARRHASTSRGDANCRPTHVRFRDCVDATDSNLQDGAFAVKAILENRDDALGWSAPQPAMNLQVTFEIARIQPAGGTLGSVRLTHRNSSVQPWLDRLRSRSGFAFSFGFRGRTTQLTPSSRDKPQFHVVVPFQIATVRILTVF